MRMFAASIAANEAAIDKNRRGLAVFNSSDSFATIAARVSLGTGQF